MVAMPGNDEDFSEKEKKKAYPSLRALARKKDEWQRRREKKK
jgi:hypothetical protein